MANLPPDTRLITARPDQLILSPAPVTQFGPAPPPDAGSSLVHLAELVFKRKWRMLALVVFITVAAGVVSMLLDPLYESTATLRIERHSVGGVVGQEAGQMDIVSDMDQVMATQVETAESDPVLRPVVEKFNLLEREKQFKGLSAAKIAAKRAAPIKLNRLKVTRPPNTYLIRITYSANEPQLAAAITNEIAASYIRHAFDSQDRAYAAISESIHRSLGDLRAKMEISSLTLAGYEKELNMVDPQQGSTIQTARLQQLVEQFTAAQVDRMGRESTLKVLSEDGSVPAAEASVTGEALDHAVERLGESLRQFAAVRTVYGENYAEYRKAKEQVDELQKQVEQLRSNTHVKVNAEYQQALGRERRLQTLVDQSKAEVDRLSARALRFEQLKRDAENDKKLYEDLERKVAETDINNQFRNAVIQLAAVALPADRKSFPNPPLNVALAFVLSLVLSVFWVVLADAVDTTLSDPEEVATRLNLHVLGVIPATRNLVSVAAIASNSLPAGKRSVDALERFTEAIRGLRTSIDLANLDRPVRSLLVSSAMPSEGKSTTAANLALCFAQIGKRVLLVDADLRAATVHKHFQIGCETGLSDVLLHRRTWREAMVKIENYNLYVVPAGPVSRRAPDMFAQAASQLFDQVSREFDLVIVDAPPILGFAETVQLAGMADGVVVIAKAGQTSGKSVARALAVLLRARANVLGLVMTQAKASSLSYGYGYGYGKYYSDNGRTTSEVVLKSKTSAV